MSLEEVEAEQLVATDIPTSRILHGEGITSIGHNLSREILRLRPDINATIHVHDEDRKSTRLNSSHGYISYAVFCLKKKNTPPNRSIRSITSATFRTRTPHTAGRTFQSTPLRTSRASTWPGPTSTRASLPKPIHSVI